MRSILIIILGFSISLVHGKIHMLRSERVNKCIKVSMVKEVRQKETEWFVFAENNCPEALVIGKQLKITVAKNVTAHKDFVLDIRQFIVPEKSKSSKNSTKKLIFNASKKSPEDKGELQWILF